MPERTVTVGSRSGLHARPAKLFVQEAARHGAAVRIKVGDRPAVPATSMLAVLSLGVGHGAAVTLQAEGDGAEEALSALAELLSRDLDAEETTDA
ncbi:HPr family phosphocarrier protein [Sphaerisporangium fuscum]|uniref:HPr family phosphocarrier protein n=1 Tax=Sphaerisporangium fuscum TaxID=2835868 RepID=UPI001BDBF09C|nr:HPr family phosphocarrier protein [Sphaerisporangium fuscum]